MDGGATAGRLQILVDRPHVALIKKVKRKKRKACGMKDESTKLLWHLALKRAFGYDLLNCPCGGKRIVLAAVQKKTEVERFLRHLHLWPGAGDVVSVTGPPELFDLEEIEAELERESAWDDYYDLKAQEAAEADWAA